MNFSSTLVDDMNVFALCTNITKLDSDRIYTLIDVQFWVTLIVGLPGLIANSIFLLLVFKRGSVYLTRNLRILLSAHVVASYGILGNTIFLSVRALLSRNSPCNLITEAYMCRIYTACMVLCVSLSAALLVCIAIERIYLALVFFRG